MTTWDELDQPGVMARFRQIGRDIRDGTLDLGRQHYALGLGHGVLQAIHCGYRRITAVELGVAGGAGLLDLCKAAAYFRRECDVEIAVWGFDNGVGLPPRADYRDHPEIWRQGEFEMGDAAALRARLPDFAQLVIGDVGETLARFEAGRTEAPVGFVAIDLDYYSSTRRALPLFTMPPLAYLPAVPVHVDDITGLISYNAWCGEAAALAEFNRDQPFRKIAAKPEFGIHNFHVCHVLDHPIRTGEVVPRLPFVIEAF